MLHRKKIDPWKGDEPNLESQPLVFDGFCEGVFPPQNAPAANSKKNPSSHIYIYLPPHFLRGGDELWEFSNERTEACDLPLTLDITLLKFEVKQVTDRKNTDEFGGDLLGFV